MTRRRTREYLHNAAPTLSQMRAQQAYPLREENEPLTVEVPLALMRYAALELGRRLAERGTIEQRDDAFFLELDDARTALRDGGDRRSVIGRRKAERAWVEAHQGPATFGRAPATPPPSMAPFPAEVRFAMEALLWDLEHEEAPAQSQRAQAPGTILNGIAASPGEYTGSARIINSEADFTKLRAGDVLVCPITSPVWSVLFPSIGGLVTDTGGILSQSAIIAREYRVPAVVATGNATKLLRDGQVVAVNGTAGVVDVRS